MDSLTESVMEDLEYEKLVDVVRSHPAIWNTADPDYFNKMIKENSWNDLCKTFYNDTWYDLSVNDKRKAGKFVMYFRHSI